MTTRKELQEWLNRFPEDTIINVGIQESAAMYDSYGTVDFVSPNLTDDDCGEGWEFFDFRDEHFKGREYYNTSELNLGEKF